MNKNVASQKLTVFAWDTTTGLGKTGDAANLSASAGVDGGAIAALTNAAATERSAALAPGYYTFTLSQAETNGDKLEFFAQSSTTDVSVIAVPTVVYTRPVRASTLAIDTNGAVTSVGRPTAPIVVAEVVLGVRYIRVITDSDSTFYTFYANGEEFDTGNEPQAATTADEYIGQDVTFSVRARRGSVYSPLSNEVAFDDASVATEATAAAVWSYGQRRLTAGSVILVPTNQHNERTIVRGDSYSATARAQLSTASDGGEWPTDLSLYTWTIEASKHQDNANEGEDDIEGVVTVVTATGDSRALRIALSDEQTSSMAKGNYEYAVRGERNGEFWTVDLGVMRVINVPTAS